MPNKFQLLGVHIDGPSRSTATWVSSTVHVLLFQVHSVKIYKILAIQEAAFL